MKQISHSIRQLVFSVAVVSLAAVTQAELIPVPNASFENRTLSGYKYLQPADTVTTDYWNNFQCIDNGGSGFIMNPSSTGYFGGVAPDGNNIGFIMCRYPEGDDWEAWPPETGGPWEPRDQRFSGLAKVLADTSFEWDKRYTLTAQVGALSSSSFAGYAVQLVVGGTEYDGYSNQGWVDGGTLIAEDWNTQEIAAASWGTSTVVYQPSSAFASLEGQPLQIRLLALEDPNDLYLTKYAGFDAVTLDVIGHLYTLDDGTPEGTMGAGAAGTMAWGNMFSVNAVTGAVLQSIEIAYGYNVAGLDATWRVFNDDDGDPTSGLVELASGTYTVVDDGPENVNVIPTGGVDVTGAAFLFIAVELTYTSTTLKPAIRDITDPQGASWVGFVPTGETFTWADGFLVDNVIYSLNWIIRGNAVPAVMEPSNPATIIMVK